MKLQSTQQVLKQTLLGSYSSIQLHRLFISFLIGSSLGFIAAFLFTYQLILTS